MKITTITITLSISILFSAVAPITAGKNKRIREHTADLSDLLVRAASKQNTKSAKSEAPTAGPSSMPSPSPSMRPSSTPSSQPTSKPSFSPSAKPSFSPSARPSSAPSSSPSAMPTGKSGKSRRLRATNLSDLLAVDDMPSSSAVTSAAVHGSKSEE